MQQHPNAMTQSLLLWLIVIMMGLFPKGMNPPRSFPTNQSQADILCVFKNFIATQPFSVRYVQSHADDTKRWRDCLLKERTTSRWIALQRRPLWQPIAQANVSKVLSQMSRSESPWGGKGDGFLEAQAGGILGPVYH
jgi:hypothetical protein